MAESKQVQILTVGFSAVLEFEGFFLPDSLVSSEMCNFM